MEKIKAAVEQELDAMRKALVTSRKGGEQNPKDDEWETMAQLYAEAVASLERIKAVVEASVGRPLVAFVLQSGVVQRVVFNGDQPEIDLVVLEYEDEEEGTDRIAQGNGKIEKVTLFEPDMEDMEPAIAEDLRHWIEHGVTKTDRDEAIQESANAL